MLPGCDAVLTAPAAPGCDAVPAEAELSLCVAPAAPGCDAVLGCDAVPAATEPTVSVTAICLNSSLFETRTSGRCGLSPTKY
jgi:hypothetical protein